MRSPGAVGIHLAQQCHDALVGRRLVSMDQTLDVHAKLFRLSRVSSRAVRRLGQVNVRKSTALLGLVGCNLVVVPIIALC